MFEQGLWTGLHCWLKAWTSHFKLKLLLAFRVNQNAHHISANVRDMTPLFAM